jgi:hypothetical protein
MKKTVSVSFVTILVSFLLAAVALADTSHKTYLSRPISLGTSGGNITDISSIYCCTGTLGSLVRDSGGAQYILSNNHVLARTNKAKQGEIIIQPGLADQACVQDQGDAVANLSRFIPISFRKGTTNKVDAAIAATQTGKVDTNGYILDIGTISSQTVAPAIGMSVKKSGRTTGLTSGQITAINTTVDVTYNKSCGIGSQKARFENQIVISGSGFSAGGDSGSVIVEDCATSPRAVGLLFAGNSTSTIANRITEALSALNVSMVGASTYCTSGTAATGEFTMTAEYGLPSDPKTVAATKIKKKHEHSIMEMPGVLGIGVGLSDVVPGEVVIKVFVSKGRSHGLSQSIPHNLEGVNVEIEETEEFKAF